MPSVSTSAWPHNTEKVKNQVIIVDQKGKFHAVSSDQLAALPKARTQKKEQNHA